MRRQTLLLRFEPRTGPPEGDPPSFDVTSGPGTLTLLEGDGSDLPVEVSYTSRVVMTDNWSFVEEGEMVFNGACGYRLSAPVFCRLPERRARCGAPGLARQRNRPIGRCDWTGHREP